MNSTTEKKTRTARQAPEDFLTITDDGRADLHLYDKSSAQNMQELLEILGPWKFRALVGRSIRDAVNTELHRVHPRNINHRAVRELNRYWREKKEMRLAGHNNLIQFPIENRVRAGTGFTW